LPETASLRSSDIFQQAGQDNGIFHVSAIKTLAGYCANRLLKTIDQHLRNSSSEEISTSKDGPALFAELLP
jgi:hypothetical protein